MPKGGEVTFPEDGIQLKIGAGETGELSGRRNIEILILMLLLFK